MENKELSKKVLEKLEQKIATDTFSNTYNIHNKSSSTSMIPAKIASIVAITTLLSGNVYTFAKYDENLFSWALKKVGIWEEYSDNKKIVNINSEYDGNKLTILDYGIDKYNLIVGYKLELSEKQDNLNINLTENANLVNDNNIYPISNNYKDIEIITKINDLEYEIYRFYDIEALKLLNNKFNFTNDITIYKYQESSKILGNWKFNFEINLNDINLEYTEYEVNCDKIILNNSVNTTIDILAIEKSELATRLIFTTNNAPMEYLGEYTIKILDANNKVLLEDGIQYVLDESKSFTDIIIGNNVLTSNIKVIVYEKDENKKILSEGMTEINFDKDLTLKKEKTKDLKSLNINDINLSFDINKVELQEQLIDHNAYFNLMKKYKNQKYYIGYMSINSYINKLNITDLNTLANDYLKVQSCYLGDSTQIELNEEYEINVLERKDLKENNIVPLISCKLTHDELIKIKDGKSLEKKGITITNDNLWAQDLKHTDIENINIRELIKSYF